LTEDPKEECQMIITLLASLAVLGVAAAAGILLSVWRREHLRAELQADEDRLAEQQEQYAAWARLHTNRPGGEGPSAVDPRDRLPI
jgi:hypothetical protein